MFHLHFKSTMDYVPLSFLLFDAFETETMMVWCLNYFY